MKKITFILFALIAGTGFAQTNVSSSAEIVDPITVSESSGLVFGKLDNTGGTMIISTAGALSGTKTLVSGTASAAAIEITGAPSESYVITVSPTATLTGAGTLNVKDIGHDSSNTLDATGNDIVNIGGTLTVVDGQAIGLYSGSISVTVSYN